MSGPRDLPQDRDVAGLYGLKPDFVDQKAPNPVDWWAIAGAGASNDVRVFDFATGYSASVVVNATAPVRLFPQGMVVREPMILNMSVNNIEFGFSPSIIFGSGGTGLIRLLFGTCWTKYGIQYVPGLVTALLGNIRIQDGVGAFLATVSNGDPGDAAAHNNGLKVDASLQGYNGVTWDRLRTGQTDADALGTNGVGVLKSASFLLGYNGATWDRIRAFAASFATNGTTGALLSAPQLVNAAGDYRTQATISGAGDANGGGNAGAVGIVGYNGATYDRLRTAQGFDSSALQVGVLAAHQTQVDMGSTVVGSINAVALVRLRNISGLNAQQVFTFDLRNVHDTLAILSVTSAGTATLLVEVSEDNTNFVTIDSLAAAASQVKQYTATTVGATTALSPLAFRWVRITAGAAGAGNTTTLTVAAK